MKKVVWRDRNHQLINTGHKTFDRQCDCIFTGNVFGHVQLSSFVRAKTEIHCNGCTNPEGHLRDYDLKHFENLPYWVKHRVERETETEPAILYCFRHWSKGKAFVHGYILTKTDKHNHRLIAILRTSSSHKSYTLLQVVSQYITETEEERVESTVQEITDILAEAMGE